MARVRYGQLGLVAAELGALPARPRLITRTLDVVLRVIFAYQRRRARRAGALAPHTGAGKPDRIPAVRAVPSKVPDQREPRPDAKRGTRTHRLPRKRAMPSKVTIRSAGQDAAQGKSPSTQADGFLREEIHHHIREG